MPEASPSADICVKKPPAPLCIENDMGSYGNPYPFLKEELLRIKRDTLAEKCQNLTTT